jgi:D-3-phosphoglycerate dehydrogenase
MPGSFFREAFEKLECSHQIEYIDIDGAAAFAPATESELRLREYLGSPDQVADHMIGVEVLAVHGAPVTDDVLAASSELRLVCCARGGPVNVDVEAVNDRRVPLISTPGKNAEAVADLTIAFLVMLARGIPTAMRFLERGGQVRNNWEGSQFMGNDLRGHTLGLIGAMDRWGDASRPERRPSE